MAKIFLAHSSKDKQFVSRLASDLSQRGIDVWIDEAEIMVGDSLLGKIEQGITETDYLMVFLSPNSVKSEWVNREVRAALTQEIDTKRIRVLPVVIEQCEIPGFLRDKRWLDFTSPRSYKLNIKKIIERVALDSSTEGAPPSSEWHPKGVRLGIAYGVLTIGEGSIEFSDEFLNSLRKESVDWVLGIATWDEVLARSIVRAFKQAPEKPSKTYIDELVAVTDEIIGPLTNYLVGIAIDAKVLSRGVGGRVSVNKVLGEELLELFYGKGSLEISSVEEVASFLKRELVFLIRARLLLYNHEYLGYEHLLVRYVFSPFFEGDEAVRHAQGSHRRRTSFRR